MPSIFVSHGAPNLLETPCQAREFLQNWRRVMPQPRAILAVSAHFETNHPAIGTATKPETIHDFGGFSRSLHEFQYPVPGAPDLAHQIADRLDAYGVTVERQDDQGLDHGIWVPLALAYPNHEVPIIPFSIQPQQDARHHFDIGHALSQAIPDDVMVVATGSMTHNLAAFRGYDINDDPPKWVLRFADWVEQRVAKQDLHALIDEWQASPEGQCNHPTDEHFLPFFVALGVAAGQGRPWHGEPVHRSCTYGVLAMDAYRFDRAA